MWSLASAAIFLLLVAAEDTAEESGLVVHLNVDISLIVFGVQKQDGGMHDQCDPFLERHDGIHISERYGVKR